MADALTNFGLLYASKEDAKLEAQVQSSLQIAQMNVLAQERAVQARMEAEERRDRSRLKAEEQMAKRAEDFHFMMEQF